CNSIGTSPIVPEKSGRSGCVVSVCVQSSVTCCTNPALGELEGSAFSKPCHWCCRRPAWSGNHTAAAPLSRNSADHMGTSGMHRWRSDRTDAAASTRASSKMFVASMA
ncbi:unnamed protein product, partial [Ectocarpus sp. 12 AP-2014]